MTHPSAAAGISASNMAQAPVTTILDEVAHRSQGVRVAVGDLFSALGAASYTPLLLLPALAVVSPLSGIPGFSSLCGLAIAVISAQMIARRPHLWTPRWLRARTMDAATARRAAKGLQRPARWLEWVARPRLAPLVEPPLVLLPQLMCLLAGLVMPFLELVPFSSSLLGASVVLLAVAMLTRDGLLALVGMVPFILGAALATALFA
ncbi:Exopolysaccharide synthesis, ExoD (plasmid) [Rhodovulum sp. P5]|uniref:exopolysaccharide biosynthesis protein n=1 Tax=Rhodovulum sp. P5 TaxID=1564506 RepID=UPI0009C35B5E|nr:exopolysaccharide biosynthesis protein [Rhodovulum sp. P5]ARE42348.1 Exopolysaccharide synthesis, ExoD [Rhodovulum sp. P5]